MTSWTDKEKFLSGFAYKLKHDIVDKEEKKLQVGHSGTFFIGIWSNLLSSLLYAKFSKNGGTAEFHTKIPDLTSDKVIFVIPSFNAFENYYLVFDKSNVVQHIDALVQTGFKRLIREEDMSHAVLSNIRLGCPFGQMADDLILYFKFL